MIRRMLIGATVAACMISSAGPAYAFGSGNDRGAAGFKGLLLGESARTAALGGAVAAVPSDLSAAASNPAGYGFIDRRKVSLSATNYVLDIVPVTAAIAWPTPQGVWAFSVDHLSYGTFDRVDATAGELGTFTAADVIVRAGWARVWKYGVSGGVSVGWIRSTIAQYSANAFVSSFGLLWKSRDGATTAGISAVNFGTATSSFAGMNDNVPSAFHLAASHRPAHFPIPLRLLADLTLPRDNEATLSVGAESHPIGPLYLRVGYNSLVRYVNGITADGTTQHKIAFDNGQESAFGGIGLSAGVGITWHDIGLDYAYRPAGAFGGIHSVTMQYAW